MAHDDSFVPHLLEKLPIRISADGVLDSPIWTCINGENEARRVSLQGIGQDMTHNVTDVVTDAALVEQLAPVNDDKLPVSPTDAATGVF